MQGARGIKTILIALNELLEADGTQTALSDFHCALDLDIETFLQSKAIDFNRRNLCRTYLILDAEAFAKNIIRIEAYFTLSIKSLRSDLDSMSKTNIKKISGRTTADTLNFVLIGQLGKRIDIVDGKPVGSKVSGNEILDYAFETICLIDEMIPCKAVLVECSDNENVRRIYENYGFKFFQNDGAHNQYIKIL